MFILCVCVCGKYRYGQLNKKRFVHPCVFVYVLEKSLEL